LAAGFLGWLCSTKLIQAPPEDVFKAHLREPGNERCKSGPVAARAKLNLPK
jgi:hypothetical protein